MHIYGDSLIAGQGEVVATRGELVAYADSMDLNLARGELWLLGEAPSVEANATLLEGDSILVLMAGIGCARSSPGPMPPRRSGARVAGADASSPDRRQRDRSRRGVGRGFGADRCDWSGWRALGAKRFRGLCPNGRLHRHPPPGGQLERVVAVGRARANTLAAVSDDSLLGNDWLVGDTITGTSRRPTLCWHQGEPELERLVAAGNARASITSSMTRPGGDHRPPAVNYVIGRVVTLALVAARCSRRRWLAPVRESTWSPAAQARADTTRSRRTLPAPSPTRASGAGGGAR